VPLLKSGYKTLKRELHGRAKLQLLKERRERGMFLEVLTMLHS